MTESNEPGYVPPDVSLLGEGHVRRYLETDGEVGYVWNGVNILLLTTRGRRTGNARISPLIFGRDGDDYIVIASVGGGPKHPAWYLNLSADPNVEVQVKDRRFPAVAATATKEEKPHLWQIMADLWPNYNVYQTRTNREIPLVKLTPK